MPQTPHRPTALHSLELHNFRSFDHLHITLHPRLTVLVARNGVGKTAVLDACALAWRPFVDTMCGATTSTGFVRADVRRTRAAAGQMVDQLPLSLTASGTVGGEALSWRRALLTARARTRSAESARLRDQAVALLGQLRTSADGAATAPPELPLLAFYGTGRLWSTGRTTARRPPVTQRFDTPADAYLDCLDPRSTFHAFEAWFERISREAQRRAADGSPAAPRATTYIEAVRAATSPLLAPTGWGHLDWSFISQCIVATHPVAGELPVAQLSDGVRNTLGLVADLAHRCVRLNPHHGAAAIARTSGVVMIDEVDMHLHPGWQQQVVPALLDAFPRLQFVVSTHSPHVLSTVPRECIRVLEPADPGTEGPTLVRTPALQTQGVPSSDVLASVMHVDPAPDIPIRKTLADYRALIQDRSHDSPEGLALRAALDAHYGLQHPEILDLDRLIRFRRALAPRPDGRPA
ncbi:MAG: AAA family ATPase [Deltaproteobacteria bacterium]|nr:AAA family ATPase [Deltaproteobacteria bacterium]